MGSWSNKPFGNDSALDWLAELEDSASGVELIGDTLKAVNDSKDIDAPKAEEAIAAAAIVAAGSQEKVSGINQDAKQWIEQVAFSPEKELKQVAITSLEKIESDSELKDLLEEAERLTSWKKEIDKIRLTLTECLEKESPKRAPKKKRLPRSIGKLKDLYLKGNDPKVKKRIIEKLLKVEDPGSQDSFTDYDLPLNIAAETGISEAIAYLIGKGANVNDRSLHGHKALPLACTHGHVEAAKILLDNGANLFESFPKYNEEGKVVEDRRVCVAILSAPRKGSPEIFNLLVDYGADLHERDLNGETLLHKAAESGNIRVMEYLIASGLNVNEHKGLVNDNERSRGESPLHYAVNRHQLLAAKLLIDNGADVNALEYFIGSTHSWFETPLDYLSGHEDSELYRYLVDNGALKACDMGELSK